MRSRLLPHLAVIGLYAAAALAVTHPLVTRLASELGGNNSDMWIFPWNAWWVAESLRGGASPFHTPYLYFPHGANLVFHTLLLPATVWAAAGLPHLSPLAFENLVLLFGFFSSAVGAYALAFFLTRSIPAALLAGMIYGFTPNRVDQARGHPDCVLGPWLPLMVLAGLIVLRAATARGRTAAALAAALAAVLALFTRPAYAIAGFYLLAFLALAQPFDGVVPRLRALAWAGVVGLLTLVLAGPYLLLMWRTGPMPEPRQGFPREHQLTAVSADSFLRPPASSLLWRHATLPPQSPGRARRPGNVGFLGYTAVALFGWAAVVCRRSRAFWFWAACAAFFLLVSMGPTVVWREQITDFPLLFPHLPLIRAERAPNRFVPALMLCVAMAAAVGWARLAARRPRLGTWGGALVALLVLLDATPRRFPTIAPGVPEFHRQLAAAPERFGIVEVPSNPYAHDKLYMYWQTLHGKPLHAGHISRLAATTLAYINSVGLLRAIGEAGLDQPVTATFDLRADLARLRADGFRYLIFHRRFPHNIFRGMNMAELKIAGDIWAAHGNPCYEDESMLAFDLRPPGER